MELKDVLFQVEAERAKQDQKWGPQNHPDIHPNDIAKAAYFAKSAKLKCGNDAKMKQENWATILEEEFFEAVEQAALGDQKALRDELIQVAAVAVAWIEAIDRRKK